MDAGILVQGAAIRGISATENASPHRKICRCGAATVPAKSPPLDLCAIANAERGSKLAVVTAWLCKPARLETVIMNMRLAALAALGREVALPASVLACIVASGSTGISHSGAAPIAGGLAQSLTADASFADKSQSARGTATV